LRVEGTNFGKSRLPYQDSRLLLEFRDKVSADRYMTDKKLVLTTAGSAEEARKIALALVERRLAACVNVVPGIRSIYRWKEKPEEAEEWLLIVKTTGAAFSKVRQTIQEVHSYGLPECIGIDISDGSEEYLEWIGAAVE
jgi:periplasmic divalent cation tolerance protein